MYEIDYQLVIECSGGENIANSIIALFAHACTKYTHEAATMSSKQANNIRKMNEKRKPYQVWLMRPNKKAD